jgi:hypothetical protein
MANNNAIAEAIVEPIHHKNKRANALAEDSRDFVAT